MEGDTSHDAGPPVFDFILFPRFTPLLEACTPFARLTGCRYTNALVQDIRGDGSAADEARFAAMPAISDYASHCKHPVECDGLLREFRLAERIVLREAVFKSLCSTCNSLDLWPPHKTGVPPDDVMYQDTSAPLEELAQRLYNFVQWRRAATGEEERNTRLSLAASFVLEFGLEHGLAKGDPDEAPQNMLMEFLARVKEYGERVHLHDLSPCFDDELPPSVRELAEQWWRRNWKGVAVGVGVLAVGAAVVALASGAAATAAQRPRLSTKSSNSSNR